MVASEAIAGAMFIAARSVPHAVVCGLALGCGGQGNCASVNDTLQRPFAGIGASPFICACENSVLKLTLVTTSLGVTLTSQEPTTSLLVQPGISFEATWIT